MKNRNGYAKKAQWAGRVISALCILFLLLDAIMKVLKTAETVKASAQLGWPAHSVQGIGIVLLACTILYSIPRTAALGALLITAYLGGATAIMIRADLGGHPYYFPVFFGILVWTGLFMRYENLRTFFLYGKPAGSRIQNS